jgi:gamma-glutamylcyclotransferase (GGCT)/AIG2-like uncharacterized protein YtfP
MQESLIPSGELVFVCGPLRRGGPDAFYMEEAEFVAPGLARGKLFDMSGLAGFVCDDTGGFVAGELYRLHADWTDTFGPTKDVLGGREEADQFRKTLVKVHPHNLGQLAVDAWLWEWTGPLEGRRAMDPGDWLYHKLPRSAPWCTAIALICLLYVPTVVAAMLFAEVFNWRWPVMVARASAIGALASPLAGIVAAFIAHRRRERWLSLRRFTWWVLMLFSIPSLILLCSIMVEWVGRIF